MEISKEMLAEVNALVSQVRVTAEEAADLVSDCRRFGCGYDYD